MVKQIAPDDENWRYATDIAEEAATITGVPASKRTIAEIYWVKEKSGEAMDELRKQFEQKAITSDEYVDAVHKNLKESMEQTQQILGDKAFKGIFGNLPDEPKIIDRDRFIREHGNNKPIPPTI